MDSRISEAVLLRKKNRGTQKKQEKMSGRNAELIPGKGRSRVGEEGL